MEYRYLADLSGDKQFLNQVESVRDILWKMDKPKGLYMTELNSQTLKWNSSSSILSVPSFDFYDSLIKSYIQTNYTNVNGKW